MNMKARDFEKAGIPPGPLMKLASSLVGPATRAGLHKRQIVERLREVAASPEDHADDPLLGELAKALAGNAAASAVSRAEEAERTEPAPWKMWGATPDRAAVDQMRNACQLPVAIQGALMPDAHPGYGLPIGGVLAVENAVIPYGVGVDIACRMMLSVTDMPLDSLVRGRDFLARTLEKETLFGAVGGFAEPEDHPVMHRDWDFCTPLKQVKGKARNQLGTSGSGNHFVEYGVLSLAEAAMGLAPGEYLAVLSHSGSRGAGAAVGNYYWKMAMGLHKGLPQRLQHLGWLGLDTDPGREYWEAMLLMGEYAAANHEIIHRKILRALKAKALLQVENHHNFAWKETYGGREMVVHRKGAIPAGKGVVGIIPGSMASPGFLVMGKGEPASLNSASHGAGRLMSRNAAKNSFAWSNVRKELEAAGVTLLSSGIDEVPGAYKDIREVMRQQEDLVEVIGRFDPKIVKMAPSGERPED